MRIFKKDQDFKKLWGTIGNYKVSAFRIIHKQEYIHNKNFLEEINYDIRNNNFIEEIKNQKRKD